MSQRDRTSQTALGRWLEVRRLQRGCSLRETAAAAGMSAMWLSKVERGVIVNPTPASLRRLAVALDLDYRTVLVRAGVLRPAPASRRAVR